MRALNVRRWFGTSLGMSNREFNLSRSKFHKMSLSPDNQNDIVRVLVGRRFAGNLLLGEVAEGDGGDIHFDGS